MSSSSAAASGDRPTGYSVSTDPTPWLDTEQLIARNRLDAIVELLPSVIDAQLRRDSGLTHFTISMGQSVLWKPRGKT